MTVLVDLGSGPGGPIVATVLAQDPTPPAGTGPEFGKASPIGLVVILLLLIATVFLVRSMTKHLRRVPASFDDEPEQAPAREVPRDPADGPSEQGHARPVDDGPAGSGSVVSGSTDGDPAPER